ncbi:MAG: hypothetical protein J3K34DRAFT_113603 [Monoraphidium minutum]|nr:MAG: hypothetical protein J3K34DRAFT_113603 [Monoraphidium minutum]
MGGGVRNLYGSNWTAAARRGGVGWVRAYAYKSRVTWRVSAGLRDVGKERRGGGGGRSHGLGGARNLAAAAPVILRAGRGGGEDSRAPAARAPPPAHAEGFSREPPPPSPPAPLLCFRIHTGGARRAHTQAAPQGEKKARQVRHQRGGRSAPGRLAAPRGRPRACLGARRGPRCRGAGDSGGRRAGPWRPCACRPPAFVVGGSGAMGIMNRRRGEPTGAWHTRRVLLGVHKGACSNHPPTADAGRPAGRRQRQRHRARPQRGGASRQGGEDEEKRVGEDRDGAAKIEGSRPKSRAASRG